MSEHDDGLLLDLEAPPDGAQIWVGERFFGYGWVLASAPVLGMSVELDGQPLAEASLGLARPDVAALHPDRVGSDRSGFTFAALTPDHPGGAACVRLIIRTALGEHVRSVPVEVMGATVAPPEIILGLPDLPPATLPANPVVEADHPLRLEVEEAAVDATGVLAVRGWALSTRAIESVAVFVAGQALGPAETGQPRADVAAAYPTYPDAATSGFALIRMLPPEAAHAKEVTVIVTDGGGDTLMRSRALLRSTAVATRPLPPPMQMHLEESHIDETGLLRVRGWVVSLSPVERVHVTIDDQPLGSAAIRLPRGDVRQAFPDYPESANAGFLLQRDAADEPFAGRTVRVVASALGGIRRDASAVVTAAPLVQRRDGSAAEILCRCEAVSLSEAGALAIKGWAAGPAGLAAIEVALGEVMLGVATLGGERPDVASQHPHLPGAAIAGFQFTGRAAPCVGEQIVRLTLRGQGGEVAEVLQPVLAQPDEAEMAAAISGAGGIRFFIDSPVLKDGRAVEPSHGFLSIHGWAFSAAGIASIEVFVDGRSQGQAYRGIRREDLLGTFTSKQALRSGFALLVPPQVMKPGRHEVRVAIRDDAGFVEETSFSIDALPSMERPGPWRLRTKVTQAEVDLLLAVLRSASFWPSWTVVLASAAAAPRRRVLTTLESLRRQAFPQWHLVLPVATEAERLQVSAALAADPGAAEDTGRVSVVLASPEMPLANLVPPVAAPALVALLSPGDELGEDALLELAIAAGAAARPDFLYSDERRIDPSDGTVRAFFKPDWSPDLLLSTNYIGRPWAATPDLLDRASVAVGDVERHGAYDLALRLTEQAHAIAHVPKVLCARGARSLDTAATERRALQRALMRRTIEAEVMPGCLAGTWRVRRQVPGAPLVSIIIPTVAERDLIRTAIRSIRQHSAGHAIEIVCIDNIAAGSRPDAERMKAWLCEAADVVVKIPDAFNWSRFNNFAARAASGDVLLFLNDDIEVTEDGWLDGLLEHALRPEVGAVGPQLLYPEGRVQQAGMFLARHVGRHAFRFSRRDEPGPFGLALSQRNVIAVTGACMMVRREVFEALGGFDEAHPIINNDLDFCLRLRATGRSVVYTPHVSLIHHEMVSRGGHRDAYDAPQFETAWREAFLLGDPYFNPNLSTDYDDYVPDEEPVRLLTVGHPVIARERVRRILAVKVDHLGDFICAFPAFRRLKQRFPNATLTVLAAPGSLPLAALEPAIDTVIPFEFFHARSERGRKAIGKKELARLEAELVPQRFDLAVDLRRQPETRFLLQHTGARWLAGFDQNNQTRWLDIAVEWEGDQARTHKRTHIADALVQFVEDIAVACASEPHAFRTDAELAAARAAVATLVPLANIVGRLGDGPLVGVHAGAGAENKQWPEANFAGLIDLLVSRHDATIVLIGGPEERDAAARLARSVREPSRTLVVAGRLGLRDLPTLLRACDLYVGNDSGPKHLAATLGVPTVGIQSGSVDAVEWAPMGPAAIGIRREVTCSPCYLAKLSDCHRGLACLTGIRVADVYRACERLLALRGGVAAAAFAPGIAAT